MIPIDDALAGSLIREVSGVLCSDCRRKLHSIYRRALSHDPHAIRMTHAANRAAGLSQTQSVRIIAYEVGLCERRVWMLIKDPG